MRRISILIIILSLTSLSYGQIFTHIMKQDKFEDTIWEKEIKTFVTIGETFITLETKGQTPLTYIIEGVTHRGSEEEQIILSNSSNVWGYEYHLQTRGKNSSKPQYIGTLEREEFEISRIVNMMVGRQLGEMYENKHVPGYIFVPDNNSYGMIILYDRTDRN